MNRSGYWAAIAFLAACGSPTDPTDSAGLIAAGVESGRVVFVDPVAGRVTGAAPFTFGPVLSAAFDATQSTAYLTVIGSQGRELVGLNTRTGELRWRLPMTDVSHPVLYDGVQLPADPVTFLPDGKTLLLGNALADGVRGIAAFDPLTKTVKGFRGPLDVLGMSVLASSGNPVAFVRTGRRPDGLVSFSMLILSANGLETVDSIAPAAPYSDPGEVAEAPDGTLFIATYTQLYAWSRQQRSVLASVRLPVFGGDMALSPDGQTVALSDAGIGFDDPGSGKVFLFDRSLSNRREVDLSAAGSNGVPVVTNRLAFSRDGRWLFAGAGTPSFGPLYGAQRSQVLVIDMQTLQLVRAIRLEDWRAPLLFLLR